MKQLILSFFFTISYLFSFGGDELYLKIRIEDYPDSSLLLTSYLGDKIKLIDTAFITKSGHFIFKSEEALAGGIYMAVSPAKKKLFEFILNENQRFSLSTDTLSYALNLKVKGSKENSVFYNYLKFNEEQYQSTKFLKNQLLNTSNAIGEYEKIIKSIDSINQLSTNYKLEIIQGYPDLFVSKLLSAMREVEIPDSITNSTDSTLAYKYLKNHYWDYFDLSDARLLRTPLLSKKVKEYFDQLVVLQPDSVIVAIDLLIAKARPCREVVDYLAWHFISVYQNPKYMGFETVFIHMVDKYFSKESIANTTPSVLEAMQKRAETLRPLQLGEPAPNLLLIDTDSVFRSFKEIESEYVVLLFWDFDCSFCKKEIKELQNISNNTKFDIGVYAINVNGDHTKWRETVAGHNLSWLNVNGTYSRTADFHDLYDVHGSPVIYLLDYAKKIIAKRISAEQIIPFLENYSKNMK